MMLVEGSRSEPLFARERACLSLAEAAVASRFHAWQGDSGRRYITSVFAVDLSSPDAGLPDLDGAIVMSVRREGMSRLPIGIFRVERHADRYIVLSSALAHGADEWHVHLLATTVAARQAAVADLRQQRCSGPSGVK